MSKLLVSLLLIKCIPFVLASAQSDQSNISWEDKESTQISEKSEKEPIVALSELVNKVHQMSAETKKFANLSIDSGISSVEIKGSQSGKDKTKKTIKDINSLKLKEIKSVDFFKNPNVFVSCLEPGYWHEIPHKINDGWKGSLIVSEEIISAILSGKIANISDLLISDNLKNSQTIDGKAFYETMKYSLTGLTQLDDETKKKLEYIKLCELTTFSDYLKINNLERFDKGSNLLERPRIGLPVKYMDGKVIVDNEELNRVLAKRLDIADKIMKITKNEIATIASRRDEMIEEDAKLKLQELKKLHEENTNLKQNLKIEEAKNKDEVTQLETALKTNLKEDIAKAEAMSTSKSNEKARQEAIAKAKKAYEETENKLNELKAGYIVLDKKLKENETQIKELETDTLVIKSKFYEEDFDKKLEKQLDKVEDYFITLSVLDPSKITANELKVKKISKETLGQIEELKILKQKNKEISDNIEKIKSKHQDKIANLENDKQKTEKELETAKQTLENLNKNGGNSRKINEQKQNQNKKIEELNKKIAEIETNLNNIKSEYTELEKQYIANEERIRIIETNQKVIDAQKILNNASKTPKK